MKELDRFSEEFRDHVNADLEYNPETGVIKKRKSRAVQGIRVVNGVKQNCRITLYHKPHFQSKHQPEKLAWLMHTGEYPKAKFMGFKNGDETDFRFENIFEIGDNPSEAALLWHGQAVGESQEDIDRRNNLAELEESLLLALRNVRQVIRKYKKWHRESGQ